MKQIIKYSWLIGIVILLQSCVKDMQDDLNNGGWNNERSIIDLKLKNQVGSAEVERIDDTTGEIVLTLNVGAIDDLSKVEIESIELSYQATASIKKGDLLDFNNSERKASISVTSDTGLTREYAVYATEFTETIEGIYRITDLVVYGGTGPEWGGGRVYPLMDKSWCWENNYSPDVEMDNTLTFVLDGFTEEGNTTGICINDAGADGKYADFVFLGFVNPATGEDVDLNHFYRQIPKGESRWVRNYATGMITFTDESGKETSGTLEGAGTYTLFDDNGEYLEITVTQQAFTFNLNGEDDWDNIYTDYDVFVKRPRKYYIMITKE